eukprot:scaffold26297_cov62-Attheya_sp.AAC.1
MQTFGGYCSSLGPLSREVFKCSRARYITTIESVVIVHGWVVPSVHRTDVKGRTILSNQERRVSSKISIRTSSSSISSSWLPLLAVSDQQEDPPPQEVVGLRLNKVFKATHSRRAADALILSGGVTVNGVPVSNQGGFKVIPFVDEVALDGTVVQGWEAMNGLEDPNGVVAGTEAFEYVKYWKPRGVTCTTDRSLPDNIIDQIINDGYSPRHRVYPVGRLDKDTSGLIVLTSDGRLPNSALRGKYKQPKVYEVHVDQPIWDEDINHLRNGVMITTVAQRDGTSMQRRKSLTARTRPCEVERLSQATIRITLVEGRN